MALEIASTPLRGAVRSVCSPGRRILNQIPRGDALMQLVDDTHAVRRQRSHRGHLRAEFPPVHRPFHLGQPAGGECGEGYNLLFREGRRAFQLQIWTARRSSRHPWEPTQLSTAVRRQIRSIVDRLRVQRPRGPSAFAAADPTTSSQTEKLKPDPTVKAVHFQANAAVRRQRILRLHGLSLFASCRHVDGNRKPLLSVSARTSVNDAILATHFGQQGHGSPTYTFVLDNFDRSDGRRDVLGSDPAPSAGTLTYSRPDGGEVSVTFVADEKSVQGGCVFAGTATAA